MCIIIAKNKNIKRLPTKEELKNCFEYNSDGAGFMYCNNGRVVIDKGYMNEKDFLNRFDYLCKKYNNFTNKSLVIHCRIGTSSTNTAGNTHPYIITNKEKELHKTFIKGDLGLAHNGIIRDYTPTGAHPTTNDTQQFILRYIYPIYANFRNFYKLETIRAGIQKITNSKFAILDKNDNLYVIGDYENENGLLFSNTSYKPFTRYYDTTATKYWNNWKDWKDYDYDWKDWDDYKKEETAKETGTTTTADETTDDDWDDLIFLDDDDYISNEFETKEEPFCCAVGDIANGFELAFNPFTYEILQVNDDGTLLKLFDNCVVYDKNWELVQ